MDYSVIICYSYYVIMIYVSTFNYVMDVINIMYNIYNVYYKAYRRAQLSRLGYTCLMFDTLIIINVMAYPHARLFPTELHTPYRIPWYTWRHTMAFSRNSGTMVPIKTGGGGFAYLLYMMTPHTNNPKINCSYNSAVLSVLLSGKNKTWQIEKNDYG